MSIVDVNECLLTRKRKKCLQAVLYTVDSEINVYTDKKRKVDTESDQLGDRLANLRKMRDELRTLVNMDICDNRDRNLDAYMSTSRVVKDEFAYVLEKELKSDYRSWMSENGGHWSARSWNRDRLTELYDRNGLVLERTTKMWRKEMVNDEFIMGLRLVSDDVSDYDISLM